MDQQNQGAVAPFSVKDMLGREIKPGTTLAFPRNSEMKLAMVDEVSISYTRANPDKPTVNLRIVGVKNDNRYIQSATTIYNPEKYMALETVAAVAATGTAPEVAAGLKAPQGAERLLIGTGIR